MAQLRYNGLISVITLVGGDIAWTHIDLFAGIGGFRLAAMRNGGRCIVAYKDHVSEIVNISDEDRNAFFADVDRAAKAIHKVFHPDKVNYGAYGDTGCHLHMHLVPKYKDGFEWGGVFAMNPGQVYLSDEEYAKMIEEIKANL